MSVFDKENAKAREQRRRAKLYPDLLAALKMAEPKLRHETEACVIVRVGTCVRCTVATAIAKAEEPITS